MKRVTLVDFSCGVCGVREFVEIDFDSSAVSTKSGVPHVHKFRNLICDGCNVVVTYPEITEDRLVEYYNGEYRDDPTSTIQIGNEHLAPPIHIHRSGISFQRFQTFHRVVASIASSLRNAPPGPGDLVIDIGGYQGMF